jgi:hypothetical protein
LATTGGLDLPSIILVGTAFATRGYLLAKRRQFTISDNWTTPLSILYFVFFAADYFLFSRSFLPATIHLALFGVVVRMFSLRRERDHITLAILAFLMVLASAVLTVDSTFLFCFATFMMMAVGTFVLMEMRRSGHAANIHARHSNDDHEHRHLAFALARVAPALMLLILIFGGALFFIMPRRSAAGYLGAYSLGPDLSSGFSDRVQLGKIGTIQLSNAVVMHIQVDGDNLGGSDLHWRGVALADFDGKTWSNPKEQFFLRHPANSFMVPRTNGPLQPHTSSLREHVIHYRVLMEPIGTNVFFLAPWARSISGDYRLVAGDSSGAVYDFDSQHPIARYEADSDITPIPPAELRAAGRNYPPQLAAYLRLPPLDPRVPQLAEKITSAATNDFDKAAAVENYLRTRFGYTLELPQTAVKDPIANFLFERKQGHCEYFASSMAVLLRSLGIPARVVNGFRSDEFNDLTGNYVVRAKNAHSWVGRSLLPKLRLANLRSHSRRLQRHAPGLEPSRPLYRCHVVVLARLDRQLRYFSSIHPGPGRLQRYSKSVRECPQLGSRPLCVYAEMGATQSGSRGAFPETMGDPRRGPRGYYSYVGKFAPGRAPRTRKVAAGLSRTFSRAGCGDVVSPDGPCLGTTRNGKTRVANPSGIFAED